jgi:hypothetical protein
MPIRTRHNSNDTNNKLCRHFAVEQIAHGVDENHARHRPRKWFHELVGHKPEIKPPLVRMAFNTPESFGECLSVAVLAARAYLCATSNRIPSSISPFNLCFRGHFLSVMMEDCISLTFAFRSPRDFHLRNRANPMGFHSVSELDCTHSTVRIFPNNVLPCPVVHQQNSRTTYGMNHPPLRTAQFLFDTNEDPFSFLTPSKQRPIAISIRYKFLTPSKQRVRPFSIRYKFRLFAQSPFRNSFARRGASRRSPLVTNHHSPIAYAPLP